MKFNNDIERIQRLDKRVMKSTINEFLKSVPFYSGVQTALFQEKIKPEYLGRVFSLTGSIMSLAMPIGLILSGFFADRIGVNHWFLLSGILIICIAIVCPMITEIRKFDAK